MDCKLISIVDLFIFIIYMMKYITESFKISMLWFQVIDRKNNKLNAKKHIVFKHKNYSQD